MSLVRWIRKNQSKVMAIVVIFLLFGFIGGGTLLNQLAQKRGQKREVFALFAENEEITNYDLALAGQQLQILKILQIKSLLAMQQLKGLFLAELLFSEQQSSAQFTARMKQTIKTNNYRISPRQIDDLYKRSFPNNVYYLLLKKEAEQSGIAVSKEVAKDVLQQVIPALFENQSYQQVIGSIVKPPPRANRLPIPEDTILETFSDLLAVLEYSRIVCTNENVTVAQTKHNLSKQLETIDVEFVRFDAAELTDTQSEPAQQQIEEHFQKYKPFFPGTVTDENPYGFGYKIPEQVQLEYIAIKLDDLSKIIQPPNDEETEQFYQRNTQMFTVTRRLDPNDPNSPVTEETKSYPEVAPIITNQLLRKKINLKANEIIQQAKEIIEEPLQQTEAADLTDELFKQLSGSCKETAEKLSKQHNIKVHYGQTGLLTPLDMQADEYLSTLYISGPGYSPARLTNILFAVEPLAITQPGPFDPPKPKLYQSIGPVRDVLGKIMVLIRIIDTKKAAEPQAVEITCDKVTLKIDQDPNLTDQTYKVKDDIKENLKTLAAMDTAKTKADEFIKLSAKKGWEQALEELNKQYEKQQKTPSPQENTFRLQTFTDLQRTTTDQLSTLAEQNENEPTVRYLMHGSKADAMLIEKLYKLIPQDSNTVETLPLVIKFEPYNSYYVIKSLSVKRISQQDYELIKAQQTFAEDIAQAESLAVVHLNPDNIVKRMNFRQVKQQQTKQEPNSPPQTPQIRESS